MSGDARPGVGVPAEAVGAAASRDVRAPWRLAIDTGGTFTDCIATDPEGRMHRLKLLSSGRLRATLVVVHGARRATLMLGHRAGADLLRGFQLGWPGSASAAAARIVGAEPSAEPRVGSAVEDSAFEGGVEITVEVDRDWFVPSCLGRHCELWTGEPAPVLCARLLTSTALGDRMPAIELRLGTTRGTNALLERQGAEVVFFVTRGFGDLLEIGTQARPEIFARNIVKTPPLYRRVIEVRERLDRHGAVVEPLDIAGLGVAAREALADGARSAAVALLHSYRNDKHEQALGAELRRIGFEHVALSSELAPLIKIVPRAQTAVVDAYLAPVVSDYLSEIGAALDPDRIWVMTSAGGLVRRDGYRPSDSLLSGPAGGVVGAVSAGRRAGCSNILSFDMGGTSTDVARYGGDYEYVYEHRVGDALVVAPALYIETVAAGGGSICSVRNGELRVGPESAGAAPGPACYGAGGPLSLTDVNLLLGRLDPDRFEIPLDLAAAEAAASRALADIADIAEIGGVDDRDRDRLLAGFLAIANERMADAMRRVSVRQGYDPSEHALVAFGGAGGQHACAIARLLGIRQVVVPLDASLLSARGLQSATIERFAHRQVLVELEELAADRRLWEILLELEQEAVAELVAEGLATAESEIRRRIVRLRLLGQESAFDVEAGPAQGQRSLAVERPGAATIADRKRLIERLRSDFLEQYRAAFGYVPERAIEVESIRVVASTVSATEPEVRVVGSAASGAHRPTRLAASSRKARREAFFGQMRTRAREIERIELERAGLAVEGPALVVERHSTTVVEPGWRALVDDSGAIVMEAY